MIEVNDVSTLLVSLSLKLCSSGSIKMCVVIVVLVIIMCIC